MWCDGCSYLIVLSIYVDCHFTISMLLLVTMLVCLIALQVVDLPGGPLTINWDEATNKVFMTGAAQKVFDGVLTL